MVFQMIRSTCTCAAAAAALWACAAGCGMQLETGYAYRPLGASAVQRRAFYASPFSPEKTAAEQENKGKGPHAGGVAPD